MSFKVGDKVIVTPEGASEVSFRADISQVYTIESIEPLCQEISQVSFVETSQMCHLGGIVLATELMKALS